MTATRDVILSAFRDVLKQPDLNGDDDFFDCGGDSLAAIALVVSLEKAGLRLPVAALFDAATPNSLAFLVESAAPISHAPCVTLKAGPAHQAVFIVPGAGGSVLEMVAFARRIDTLRPVYGLQPRDADGRLVTLNTVEDAAEFYLKLIRAAQPASPYIIAGYSLGGMIALELAQTLRAAGETVERLIILDTLTPIEHFPLAGKLRFWFRRAMHHAQQLRRLSPAQVSPYIMKRARALVRDFRPRVSTTAPDQYRQPLVPTEGAQPPLTAAGVVFLKYRPKFFRGPVVYIRSQGISGKTHYPDLLWRYLAAQVEIINVEGDHVDMLSSHPESLAKAFSLVLPITHQ